MSPLSLPLAAPVSRLSINDVEKLPLQAISGAFAFWLLAWSVVAIWLVLKARSANRDLKARVFAEGRVEREASRKLRFNETRRC
jgi:hypothetical protein